MSGKRASQPATAERAAAQSERPDSEGEELAPRSSQEVMTPHTSVESTAADEAIHRAVTAAMAAMATQQQAAIRQAVADAIAHERQSSTPAATPSSASATVPSVAPSTAPPTRTPPMLLAKYLSVQEFDPDVYAPETWCTLLDQALDRDRRARGAQWEEVDKYYVMVQLLGTSGTLWHASIVDSLQPHQKLYSGFRPLFIAKFRSHFTQDEIIGQLYARAKKPAESFESYALELEKLGKGVGLGQSTFVTSFVMGVDRYIANLLRAAPCTTLDATVKQAMKFAEGDGTGRHKDFTHPLKNPAYQGKRPRDHYDGKNDHGGRAAKSMRTQPKPFTGNCFACQEPGHMARDCPRRHDNKQQANDDESPKNE